MSNDNVNSEIEIFLSLCVALFWYRENAQLGHAVHTQYWKLFRALYPLLNAWTSRWFLHFRGYTGFQYSQGFSSACL